MTPIVEPEQRRFFRRERYEHTDDGYRLVQGPWHLATGYDRDSRIDYAACGVQSYMARNRPERVELPVGQAPEGKFCAKCLRAI